jgi:hypothetical protein
MLMCSGDMEFGEYCNWPDWFGVCPFPSGSLLFYDETSGGYSKPLSAPSKTTVFQAMEVHVFLFSHFVTKL